MEAVKCVAPFLAGNPAFPETMLLTRCDSDATRTIERVLDPALVRPSDVVSAPVCTRHLVTFQNEYRDRHGSPTGLRVITMPVVASRVQPRRDAARKRRPPDVAPAGT